MSSKDKQRNTYQIIKIEAKFLFLFFEIFKKDLGL